MQARAVCAAVALLAAILCAAAAHRVHEQQKPMSSNGPALYYSYLWHLQQPIYWPAYLIPDDTSNHPTYQRAYQSIQLQQQQGGHPQNNLGDIFGKDDRVAIYQYRAKDALDTVRGQFPDFGVQITYPGDLIDNVNSLAQNGAYGYSNGWNGAYTQAVNQYRTSKGNKALDIVQFTYHHSFAPLIDKNMLLKSLLINQVQYKATFGDSTVSKGYFPTEMAFSERIIPVLVQAGIEWAIVPNNHISRACANYSYSTWGDNNTPPNNADALNPPQSVWYTAKVDRGCAPNNAVPFSYRPHNAEYVDPDSGATSRVVVVPSAMAMSWDDSEQCYNTDAMDYVAQHSSDPKHPPLIVLSHDGDNDFSGGYSYYMQCVSQLAGMAASHGYQELPIQQYLDTYPVDDNDVVHVEDGAWINHDSDFGDPQFIWGWNGIPMNDSAGFDVPNGWNCNLRNWAIIMASQNWVDTAEQVVGGLRISEVQAPTAASNPAEVAWHFHLVEPSGWLYYGCPLMDMQDKPALSANNAITWARKVVTPGATSDQTPPTVWIPQRFPYNPGGWDAGAKWHYKETKMPNDFYIYTFIYDVSGVRSAQACIRLDKDGVVDRNNKLRNPPAGSSPGPWTCLAMSEHDMEKGDTHGVHFDVVPQEISGFYWYHVVGLQNVLVDYYVFAVDQLGNKRLTDIQHVYVGDSAH